MGVEGDGPRRHQLSLGPDCAKGTTAAAAGPIYLNVRAIVIESGADQIGERVIEKLNVVEDVRVVLGKLLNAPLPSDADPQSAYKTNCRSVLDDDTIYL